MHISKEKIQVFLIIIIQLCWGLDVNLTVITCNPAVSNVHTAIGPYIEWKWFQLKIMSLKKACNGRAIV